MCSETQECLSAFSPRTSCDSDAGDYGSPVVKTSIVTKGSRLGPKTICGLVSVSLIYEPCHLRKTTFPSASLSFVMHKYLSCLFQEVDLKIVYMKTF